jgi:formate C-acetyltransferase
MKKKNDYCKIPDILIRRITEDTDRYIEWLKKFDTAIESNLLLAGSFQSPEYPVWPRPHDNFHYPIGMKKLLGLGFSGIGSKAWSNASNFNGNEKLYLRLIHRVYTAIIRIIESYAVAAKKKRRSDIYTACHSLLRGAPSTFREACQLYWFAAIFRIGTSTIGRIDQHLYPFYEKDLKSGLITEEEGRKLVAELLYRFEMRGGGHGDTLQNITLSGRNAAGKDKTNELTYMILELMLENRYIDPKINVRLHKKSPGRLLEMVSRFQLTGTGLCTVFNDDAVIEGLKKYGRPGKISEDYCADGCTEIILDGYGETSFRYIDCVKAVEHTLFSGKENVPVKKRMQYYAGIQELVDINPPVPEGKKTESFLSMKTFEDFYKAYLSQLKYQIDAILSAPYNSNENPMRLFTAATMPEVIEKARNPYSNKACWHTYGLFIGSLGTAANSIAAIKHLVYEKKLIKKEALLEALKNNFGKNSFIQRLCLNAPKFGNDDDYVDSIAIDIARRFAVWVKKYKDSMERPVLPGLYNHLFHHTAYYVGATPDGRKNGDPVGEHISPTPGTALKGPTSVINTVTKIKTSEHIFGSTLHLNIPLASLKGTPDPAAILKHLTLAFMLKGGCVININILDAEKLIEARKHPEKYRDLVVRVWGFSYYFVGLSREMQDHVIARCQSE